ncbi:MAG: hypothetical protein H6701_14560 [Myxococcales bacterium]|nr:hypothetical protein [Myxococcales bacterium]
MSDAVPIELGTVFRVPLGDGTAGMGQVVGVDGGVVAIALADVIWDCEPGLLDWEETGRALTHLALRPAALVEVVPVGQAAVDAASMDAHARWQTGDRAVVAAPPALVLRTLLS